MRSDACFVYIVFVFANNRAKYVVVEMKRVGAGIDGEVELFYSGTRVDRHCSQLN